MLRSVRLLCAAAVALAVLPASSAPREPARAPAGYVVAQMNLCNSGLARSCYSAGRAVREAAAAIRRHRADLVTVQEVCAGDLRALAAAAGGPPLSVAFTPAVDRDTGTGYRCTNGELFGVALLARGALSDVRWGWYASQDRSDEVRPWTCAVVLDGQLTGCTTHLSTDPRVALRQCRELVSVLRSPWARPAVLVAGDLNLSADRPDLQGCLPSGFGRQGDGAVQHIVSTGAVRPLGGGSADLPGTDHPLLYGTFGV